MRKALLFAILALFTVACFAELSHVSDIYIKDSARWLNLSTPSAVWPAGNGRVYVLDTYNHRIVEFYGGEPNKVIAGNSGSVAGMLFPRSFWLAEDGRFYIANTGNNNIIAYENGNFLYGIAVSGSDAYSFDRPAGIAVYNGTIYASDGGRGVIKKFSQRDRAYFGTIGIKGFGEEQLSEPAGLDISGGLLYVADRDNNRVQVFSLEGAHVMAIRGAYECSLNKPQSVSVDKEGTMFVSDTGNDRIVVFGKDGQCIETLSGGAWGSFSEPIGIKVDGSGMVYVADSKHAVVRVFKYTSYYQSEEAAAKEIDKAEAVHKTVVGILAAATHLGIGYEDEAQALFEKARLEFNGKRFSSAYFNATLSIAKSTELNTTVAQKVHSEVLKAVLENEGILDVADQEAGRYGNSVDSQPLRSELSRIRAMLDANRFSDAAFNITELSPEVLAFKASVSGTSSETAKERDSLLLAVSDARNELSGILASAEQYKLQANTSEIASLLDGAKEACESYDFDRCRSSLSVAKGKTNDARVLIEAHAARVESARKRISAAGEALGSTYSSAYFFRPDLSPAEQELAGAEAVVATDPDGAVEKVNAALMRIEDAKASIDRTNLLAIIGIAVVVLLLVAALGIYYVTRGKPRKRKGK